MFEMFSTNFAMYEKTKPSFNQQPIGKRNTLTTYFKTISVKMLMFTPKNAWGINNYVSKRTYLPILVWKTRCASDLF